MSDFVWVRTADLVDLEDAIAEARALTHAVALAATGLEDDQEREALESIASRARAAAERAASLLAD